MRGSIAGAVGRVRERDVRLSRQERVSHFVNELWHF
jgi:hypothetical protein